MHKRRRFPEILLGVFLTIAALGMGWSFSALNYHVNDNGDEKAQEACTKSQYPECLWERTLSDPVAFYSLWVALFTGVLGGSTIFLWQETKNARILANKVHADEERPWLSLEVTGAVQQFERTNRLDLVVSWTALNSGKTPAIDVCAYADVLHIGIHMPSVPDALSAFVRRVTTTKEPRDWAPQVAFPQSAISSRDDTEGFRTLAREDRDERHPPPNEVGSMYWLMVALVYRGPDPDSGPFQTAFMYRVDTIGGDFIAGIVVPHGQESRPFTQLGVSLVT